MPSYTTGSSHPGAAPGSLEQWPKCVQEYLAQGVAEGDRNNTLFRMAAQCHHARLTQGQVAEILVARAQADGLSEAEARATIKNAFRAVPSPKAASSSG